MSEQSNHNSFSVRRATIADYPRLMILMYAYISEFEDKPEISEDEKNAMRRSVMDAILNDDFIFAIAELTKYKKSYAIGYGAFDLRPDIFGKVMGWGHHLYVDPKFRQSGVTGQIVNFAENFSRSAGAKEFYIDTKIPGLFRKKFNYKDLYVVLKKSLVQE